MQRLTHTDIAAKGPIKILRRIAVKINRAIMDQAFGMHQTGLKRHAIDKRLQGGSRRAQRLGHIDKALPRAVGIGGGAHRGDDLSGLVIHRQQRRRDPRARTGRRLCHQLFHLGLDFPFQGQR